MNLDSWEVEAALASAGIDIDARPEEVEFVQFVRLAGFLA
jgi:hypothetical protein